MVPQPSHVGVFDLIACMIAAWRPEFVLPLPEGHRFPMLKYALLKEQLIYEGIMSPSSFFSPPKAPLRQLLLTHQPDYVYRVKNQLLSDQEVRKIGFPQSRAMYDRELFIVEGTYQCARYALDHGVALNTAGGTHHAFADRGEGFCIFNDFAYAANRLLHEGLCKRILILDLDVHQGNGTASLFYQHESVFTCSLHGAANYPLIKEKSSLDIALEAEMEDETYLSVLADTLGKIKSLFQPDMVMYQAGVDVLDTDRYGKLNLTIGGCKLRDEMVFSHFSKIQIPVVAAMGGGYSKDINRVVAAHVNTFKSALLAF